MISFLKRSSSIFLVTALIFFAGGVIIVPNDSFAANAEGLYNGSFNGEHNGTWFLLINGSKEGQIYFWLTAGQVVDKGKVEFNGKGGFTFNCTYGVSGSGEIAADGKISGAWKFEGISGELNGSRQDLSEVKSLEGTYTSDGTGDEACRWTLNVASDGSIKGTVSWEKNGLIEQGSGAVNSEGEFIFLTKDDTSAYGSIDSSGKLSGTWNNPFWEIKGTLGDASKVKNSSSSSSKTASSTSKQQLPVYVESEDESGCFMETLLISF